MDRDFVGIKWQQSEGFQPERSDPIFVNTNQQQSSSLTQQDVFHKSQAKRLHSLLHAKLLVPEPGVKSWSC